VNRQRSIGLIVGTSGYSDDEREHRRALLQRLLPPGCEARVEAVMDGPEFFDRGDHFADAAEAAVSYFRRLPPGVWDVIIWAGAIDPGLNDIRTASPVPVVGPGEASMFVAATLRTPVSVVTVDEHAVEKTYSMLGVLSTKPPIASVRSMDMPVRRIVQDRELARRLLHREVEAAVGSDGAGAVYLGAMTLATLGVEEELRAAAGVPILSPLEVAAAAAAQVALARPSHRLTENR